MFDVILAILNGSGAIPAFPIQIATSTPSAGGAAIDPAVVIGAVAAGATALTAWRSQRQAKAASQNHAISQTRTEALTTGLTSVLNSLKATDIAGKDNSVLINQLIKAISTVPAVAEVVNKPISEVAPTTVSDADSSKCLVEKSEQNAQEAKHDIQTYYNNKPALPNDTSPDPVVRAVGEVQKQTMVTD